ncbi:uncharacterized protein BX663DRAFT_527449 [Cokeromyces recurvatus]|uniref:uncharacterized protein n=1 Tax=Cokeromyces recurvatus TaxID=90255 RepID=UPI002220C542|nr:uncharacterized protein BX663DRAFT_527449 [Cokeromyces recurvatus]KAI7897650.1 hypothetical protein BX663DRAFT_527449 [Cokeromyces recurvatus]
MNQPFAPLQPQQQLFVPQSFQPLQPVYGGPNTQGYFSSYSSRIKQSKDNALLLPSSYISEKKHRLIADDSDDDFEEFLENEEYEESKQTTNAENFDQSNLPKVPHKKNFLLPPTQESLNRVSETTEILVPIRLDIDLDDVKLRDVFLWNMNEQYLTPEMFAELLCEDLQLDTTKFIKPISESIRAQVIDFEAVYEYELPNGGNKRVEINLDLQIGKVNLRDKFEWDLDNVHSNAPEVFSRQLAAELGLGGEYVSIIAHGIRDQLFRHRKRIVEEYEGLYKKEERLETGFRKLAEAANWVPKLEVLSNDELEKLLIAQERNIRRLRRETRFKRTRRARQ